MFRRNLLHGLERFSADERGTARLERCKPKAIVVIAISVKRRHHLCQIFSFLVSRFSSRLFSAPGAYAKP
jgi:hypothetical protein